MSHTPTTVFTGGEVIIAVDQNGSTLHSNALAIADGRVVAHGAAADSLRSSHTVLVVDLDGGTLIPALGDGHAHPMLGALESEGPAIRQAKDLQGILDAVQAWKSDHPEASWIIGGSYDATFAPGGRFDARWLDEVTGETPTLLRAWDYHTVWVNSAALRAAGITKDTPAPRVGRIVRRADGSPLGTLQEEAANEFISRVLPARSLESRVAAIQRATQLYAEQGTTWVQDAWVDPGDVEPYLVAAGEGRLRTRVNLALRADPGTWRDQLTEFARTRTRVRELGSERLSAETIKFFVDGIVESHTASLISPYADDPTETGLPNWTSIELAAATRAFDEAGFQLHLHAIGDHANRMALDALEAVRDSNPPRERHHVIAHVALLHPDDIARFADLDVIANFEPYWAQCDAVMRDLTIPHIGHDREGWQYLIGSVLRAGATISFGSDWPVTTQDWRPAMSTAITRRSHLEPDAQAWLPAERITVEAALSAYTAGIARQALAPDRGTLELGKVADLAWLSGNPLEEPPEAIPKLKVLGTWLAGERVH